MKNYALVIEQGDSLIVTIPDEFVRQHMLVRGDHLKRTIDGKRIILEVQDDWPDTAEKNRHAIREAEV